MYQLTWTIPSPFLEDKLKILAKFALSDHPGVRWEYMAPTAGKVLIVLAGLSLDIFQHVSIRLYLWLCLETYLRIRLSMNVEREPFEILRDNIVIDHDVAVRNHFFPALEIFIRFYCVTEEHTFHDALSKS